MAKYAVKEVVDLSHEFFEGMPNIAGLPVTQERLVTENWASRAR